MVKIVICQMKTEIAYPYYAGSVSPQYTTGLDYTRIAEVLTDPRVIECLTSLLCEVLKHPLVPREPKYNQDYYDTVSKVLYQLDYIRLAMTISAAYITGRSPIEVIWGDQDGMVLPQRFIPRPGDALYYRWDNSRDGYYPVIWARGKEFSVSDYPRQFIIAHYWAIPNGDPYGNGLAESLYPLVQVRGRALEDWAKYSSVYSEPTRVGHYPNTAADAEIVQFNEFVNKMGRARAVTLPDGFNVEYINPPSGSEGTQSNLYATVSQDISLLILGEGTAGRQHVGGTATQDEVSEGLRGSRAYLLGSLIASTISRTISRWVGELNFPGEPPLELTFDPPKPPDEAKAPAGAEGLDPMQNKAPESDSEADAGEP